MLEELKEIVWQANLRLPEYHLVTLTWGNVSGIDRAQGLLVIKPSGVEYERLRPDELAVVDVEGNLVEGGMKPSSDTLTHIALYKAFPGVGGIVHTHSPWATTWAQAGYQVPALGTTHADTFHGPVLCTRALTEHEISGSYEEETGNVIAETFRGIDPLTRPGVLVHSHGPFTWGADPSAAVQHAVILEEVAKLAYQTVLLNRQAESLDSSLLDRHFFRKHGPRAYYGQD